MATCIEVIACWGIWDSWCNRLSSTIPIFKSLGRRAKPHLVLATSSTPVVKYVTTVPSPVYAGYIDGVNIILLSLGTNRAPPPKWFQLRRRRLRGTITSARSRCGGLRTLSAIDLFDTGKKARIADHLRSVRRPRSGSAGGRTQTGFDSPRHRTPVAEWYRSRSTNSQACSGIQDSLREPGVFSLRSSGSS